MTTARLIESLATTVLNIEHKTTPFNNWGKTVGSKPSYTFYPKTIEDICHIVTWAKAVGKHVRVSAYKHTWQNVFAKNGDILISLLHPKESDSVPAKKIPLENSNPFQTITLIEKSFFEDGKRKHLCKIGAATTNEQFRSWALNQFQSYGNTFSWSLPWNVILVENTFGGTNAMMCHGAGLPSKTVSDLVTEIEFINPKGEIQTIGYKPTDSIKVRQEGIKLIKTAAGSFGQLGVVTSLTVKLDQMTHARMQPNKPRLALAIPPPDGYVLPDFLPKEIMQDVTPKQLRKAKEEFIQHIENDYYTEWFWFSLHSHCWVNSWKNDGDVDLSKSYPLTKEVWMQEIATYLSYISSESLLKLLSDKHQALLLSDAAMLSLPAGETIITPLSDALHFRHGIHNMPVQDMEFEIPIPALLNGKPDWSICQRAWWDAIVTVYEWLVKKNKVPMRLPLEMRIMGGSDVTMAAQKDNFLGTCSIEVLTLSSSIVDKSEWHEFMQAILDKWSAYTDVKGKPLNIRPHWAKQWQGLTIARKGEERKDLNEYLKEVYEKSYDAFNHDLKRIAEKGGYALEDFDLFKAPMIEQIFNKTTSEDAEIYIPAASIVEEFSDEEKKLALYQLIIKTQQAHLAKEIALANKLHKDLHQIKKINQLEKHKDTTHSLSAPLLANTWFSTTRKLAQENQLLLENKLTKAHAKNTNTCTKKCNVM